MSSARDALGLLGGALLVGAMWLYSASVLVPARALRRTGITAPPGPASDLLPPSPAPGLGRRFSVAGGEPVLLDRPTPHDHLVADFDRMSGHYDRYVRPFSQPIFDEAIGVMARYLRPESRVLDLGCGPGRELRRVAALVPAGEVIGVDLAAEMLRRARQDAAGAGTLNAGFFQADVGDLPAAFTGAFDFAYSCLAHHHFPEPAAAAASVLRCLRPGGVYCVIDPGSRWFNFLAAPLARVADPGWIGFHDPAGFRSLLASAGFARTAWVPLLPGVGLALGQKP